MPRAFSRKCAAYALSRRHRKSTAAKRRTTLNAAGQSFVSPPETDRINRITLIPYFRDPFDLVNCRFCHSEQREESLSSPLVTQVSRIDHVERRAKSV